MNLMQAWARKEDPALLEAAYGRQRELSDEEAFAKAEAEEARQQALFARGERILAALTEQFRTMGMYPDNDGAELLVWFTEEDAKAEFNSEMTFRLDGDRDNDPYIEVAIAGRPVADVDVAKFKEWWENTFPLHFANLEKTYPARRAQEMARRQAEQERREAERQKADRIRAAQDEVRKGLRSRLGSPSFESRRSGAPANLMEATPAERDAEGDFAVSALDAFLVQQGVPSHIAEKVAVQYVQHRRNGNNEKAGQLIRDQMLNLGICGEGRDAHSFISGWWLAAGDRADPITPTRYGQWSCESRGAPANLMEAVARRLDPPTLAELRIQPDGRELDPLSPFQLGNRLWIEMIAQRDAVHPRLWSWLSRLSQILANAGSDPYGLETFQQQARELAQMDAEAGGALLPPRVRAVVKLIADPTVLVIGS